MNEQTAVRRPFIHIGTTMWISFVLAVTLKRSLPGLSPTYTTLALLIAVAGLFWFILVIPTGQPRAPVPIAERRLLTGLLLVPVVAALLAVSRSEFHNVFQPGILALSFIAIARMPAETRLPSAWHALRILLLASLILGLVMPSAVAPNARAFLRPIYDGRLVGLLQTPNFLGVCSVIFILLTITLSPRRQWMWLALGLIAILAASSQTALGVAILSLTAWIAWRASGNRHLGLMAWAGILATVIAALWLVAGGTPGISISASNSQTDELTFSSRTKIWQLILSHDIPFTGLGSDGLFSLITNTVIQGASGIGSAHNIAIEAYARDGVPGALALTVGVFAMVRYAVLQRAWLGFPVILAFLIEGALEVSPAHAPFFPLFLVALLAAGQHPQTAPRDRDQQRLISTSGSRSQLRRLSPDRGLGDLRPAPRQGLDEA